MLLTGFSFSICAYKRFLSFVCVAKTIESRLFRSYFPFRFTRSIIDDPLHHTRKFKFRHIFWLNAQHVGIVKGIYGEFFFLFFLVCVCSPQTCIYGIYDLTFPCGLNERAVYAILKNDYFLIFIMQKRKKEFFNITQNNIS